MKVENGTVVGVDYTLHLGDGKIVDQSEPGHPMHYLHGEHEIVLGLERALSGMSVGERKQVVISAADGYGEHNAQGLEELPRDSFPEDAKLEVGAQFVAEADDGVTMAVTVRELKADTIVVDLNHPLAGRTLHFDVEVKDLRAATAEELEHGHLHEPDDPPHDE